MVRRSDIDFLFAVYFDINSLLDNNSLLDRQLVINWQQTRTAWISRCWLYLLFSCIVLGLTSLWVLVASWKPHYPKKWHADAAPQITASDIRVYWDCLRPFPSKFYNEASPRLELSMIDFLISLHVLCPCIFVRSFIYLVTSSSICY
jgi:hypothetical protein